MLILHQIEEIIETCSFENYTFIVKESFGRIYVYAEYLEDDIDTGSPELQTTRKWLISPCMTRSEVVQTLFKLCLTSMEHKTREMFLYRGRRIFGPHFDVDALHGICDQLDSRKHRAEA